MRAHQRRVQARDVRLDYPLRHTCRKQVQGGAAVGCPVATLVSGQRVIVYPSVDIPFRRTWGYVVPKVGVDFTQYKLDQSTGDDSPSRTLPIASIDSGLFFDRSTTWAGRAFS